MAESAPQQMRILLVEDDPGDALITTEAMRASNVPNEVRVVEDGEAALALVEGAASADSVWTAAHVDEDWQAELWGTDAEAEAVRAARRRDYDAAVRFLLAASG